MDCKTISINVNGELDTIKIPNWKCGNLEMVKNSISYEKKIEKYRLEYSDLKGEINNIINNNDLEEAYKINSIFNLIKLDKEGDVIMNEFNYNDEIESFSDSENESDNEIENKKISNYGKTAIKEILSMCSEYGIKSKETTSKLWLELSLADIPLLKMGLENRGGVEESIIITLDKDNYISNGLGDDINKYLKFEKSYGLSNEIKMFDPRGKEKKEIETMLINLMEFYTY